MNEPIGFRCSTHGIIERAKSCPICDSIPKEPDRPCPKGCGLVSHGNFCCMCGTEVPYPHTVGELPVLTELPESSLDRIRQAQAGQRGPQQKLIALLGLQVVDLLLRKNHDYGGSVFDSPEMLPDMKPTDALMVRMSDKIQRMKSLMTQEAEVNESMEDTMKDQAGYSILWLCCNWIEQGKWNDDTT